MKFVALFMVWAGWWAVPTALPWTSLISFALGITDYEMLIYTHDELVDSLAVLGFGLLLFVATRGCFRGLSFLHRFGVKLVR